MDKDCCCRWTYAHCQLHLVVWFWCWTLYHTLFHILSWYCDCQKLVQKFAGSSNHTHNLNLTWTRLSSFYVYYPLHVQTLQPQRWLQQLPHRMREIKQENRSETPPSRAVKKGTQMAKVVITDTPQHLFAHWGRCMCKRFVTTDLSTDLSIPL